MKILKLPSRSSLLSAVLALTLGLSTVALADPQSGYDVGADCAQKYGDATSDWADCVNKECQGLHPGESKGDSGYDACVHKAAMWDQKPATSPD